MRHTKIKDIKIPKDFSLEKTGCTQSLAHCFKQCPLKFLLKINRWQSKKNQDKTAIGLITHDVLARIYKLGKQVTERMVYNYIEKSIKNNPDDFRFIKLTDLTFYKTVCYCVITNYILYYQKDFKTAKFMNTEREFAVEIFDILWRGKIDGEHLIKKEKSLWVLERKTKGRISDDTITRSLSLDFQGRLYCKAKEVEFKNNVLGFIYDVIRTPQMRLRKNDTLDDFQKRLNEDIEKRPDYYFMRWEVPLTKQDKESFQIDLNDLSHELLDYIHNGYNVLKRNTFACNDGIVPCEYLDACIQENMSGYFQSDRIFTELNCGL